ncbi:MAG: adenosylmethionine--8-amino-7-oxononanoate transaminase [Bacteroidales bacterium]|jgi:adenosylmethionine-8-amino-7-oxononanoate aminotransferase|nr:adenosylmethionine--8-amino-7-oxononanoate transaminase [Bacteroidales bacterium]
MNYSELIAIDKHHIWHPYSSINSPVTPELISRADGVYLHTHDGKQIIDGMSSWWSAIHGYNHSTLNNAATEQLNNMSHVMFGGLTHRPAIELAAKILDIVPQNLRHIFYSDSGSVSVEVAMKMAVQYWYSKNQASKHRFATMRGGYHGDTWHAMSVCDPENGMHNIFSDSLPQQFFVPRPQSLFGGTWHSEDIDAVHELFKKHHTEIAAFILEPIVQGAGGMYFYHRQFLVELRTLCNEFNILLIADEIATGFGRTGKMFACEHANIEPDILCMGKSITGGYMSFAATVCTTKIAQTISDNAPGVFMHGPTFMGNPLACAVASANISLLCNSEWQDTIALLEQQLQTELSPLESHSAVHKVRVLGAIGVVEMKEAVDMKKIQPLFVKHGVWIRPFGKLIYTMPAYIMNSSELHNLCEGIKQTIHEVYGK